MLQDKEGVDFRYYFGQKYQMCHSRHDSKKSSNRGGRGGKQRGGKTDDGHPHEESKVEDSQASSATNEEKLSSIYQHLHKYIF